MYYLCTFPPLCGYKFHRMTCQRSRWGCPTHKFRPPILSTIHLSVIPSYKLLDPITKRKRGHPHYWQMPQHPPISTTQAQTLRLSDPTFHTVPGFLALTAGQNTVWTSLEISQVLSVKTQRIRFQSTKWSCAISRHSWLVFFFLQFQSSRHNPGHIFSVSEMTQNNFSILQSRDLLKRNVLTTVAVHLESQVTFSSCQKQTSPIPGDCEFFRLYGLHAGGFYFKLFATIGAHANGAGLLYMNGLKETDMKQNLIEAKDNNDQSQQYAHSGKSGTTKLFWQNTRISGWSRSVWGEHLCGTQINP